MSALLAKKYYILMERNGVSSEWFTSSSREVYTKRKIDALIRVLKETDAELRRLYPSAKSLHTDYCRLPVYITSRDAKRLNIKE